MKTELEIECACPKVGMGHVQIESLAARRNKRGLGPVDQRHAETASAGQKPHIQRAPHAAVPVEIIAPDRHHRLALRALYDPIIGARKLFEEMAVLQVELFADDPLTGLCAPWCQHEIGRGEGAVQRTEKTKIVSSRRPEPHSGSLERSRELGRRGTRKGKARQRAIDRRLSGCAHAGRLYH